MTVEIPPELEQCVHEKVARGEFKSRDAFVCEAMRLYRQLEARHEQLQADVERAMKQIERGEGVELSGDEELREVFNDFKARGRQRLEARKNGG